VLTAHVGDLEIHALSDGTFALDGGAMFGVVPRVLWERHLPPDALHRVGLGLNCLLVRAADGQHVLCDTGLGDRWDDGARERLALDGGGRVVGELATLGLAPEDVDVVVLSHLHFDHAGGAVRRGADGALAPTFPRARHVVQAAEWREARSPHERHRASYRPDDFLPLESAGVLELVEGTIDVAPGVRVSHAPGHCPGLQVVTVESAGETLVFPSDLLPTRAHLRPTWHMGFDLDARATVDAKTALLAQVAAGDWIVAFDHDASVPLARLRPVERGGRTDLEAVPLGVEATR
jgi:glyoxylase-like metal-dependent hydrolase (beta-lactamase superfamily II)